MPESRVAAPHPFFCYTTEILAWRLGQPTPAAPFAPPDAATTARRVGRVLRAVRTCPHVLLLGLGTGALAAALARELPEATSLTVVCADPAAARRLAATGGLAWRSPEGRHQLLVDISATALFFLLRRHGCSPQTALVTVNPEGMGPEETRELGLWRQWFAVCRPLAERPGSGDSGPVRPTLAVLARPEEPDLADFFGAVAGLAGQAVVLWDGRAVPAVARQAEALGVPVTHLARPLAGDFAAQRNVLLAACPPGWVLSLDPDERPGPGFGAALTRLMAVPELGGVFFPRLTLDGEGQRGLAGYGLWPDLQLRLFRTGAPAQPRYVQPVHERLEGLAGRAGLTLDAGLIHRNRVHVPAPALAAKLAAYAAIPGAPAHRASAAYPSLPCDFFASPPGLPPGGRVLLAPPLW